MLLWCLNFKLQLVDPSVRVDREKGTYRRQKQLVWYSSTALVIWHPTNVFVAPAVAPTAAATQLRSAVKHYLLVFSFSFLRCDFLLWQLRWPIRFYGSLIKDSEVKLPKSEGSPLTRKIIKFFQISSLFIWTKQKRLLMHRSFFLMTFSFLEGSKWERKFQHLVTTSTKPRRPHKYKNKSRQRRMKKQGKRVYAHEQTWKKKDVPKYYPHT